MSPDPQASSKAHNDDQDVGDQDVDDPVERGICDPCRRNGCLHGQVGMCTRQDRVCPSCAYNAGWDDVKRLQRQRIRTDVPKA